MPPKPTPSIADSSRMVFVVEDSQDSRSMGGSNSSMSSSDPSERMPRSEANSDQKGGWWVLASNDSSHHDTDEASLGSDDSGSSTHPDDRPDEQSDLAYLAGDNDESKDRDADENLSRSASIAPLDGEGAEFNSREDDSESPYGGIDESDAPEEYSRSQYDPFSNSSSGHREAPSESGGNDGDSMYTDDDSQTKKFGTSFMPSNPLDLGGDYEDYPGEYSRGANDPLSEKDERDKLSFYADTVKSGVAWGEHFTELHNRDSNDKSNNLSHEAHGEKPVVNYDLRRNRFKIIKHSADIVYDLMKTLKDRGARVIEIEGGTKEQVAMVRSAAFILGLKIKGEERGPTIEEDERLNLLKEGDLRPRLFKDPELSDKYSRDRAIAFLKNLDNQEEIESALEGVNENHSNSNAPSSPSSVAYWSQPRSQNPIRRSRSNQGRSPVPYQDEKPRLHSQDDRYPPFERTGDLSLVDFETKVKESKKGKICFVVKEVERLGDDTLSVTLRAKYQNVHFRTPVRLTIPSTGKWKAVFPEIKTNGEVTVSESAVELGNTQETRSRQPSRSSTIRL